MAREASGELEEKQNTVTSIVNDQIRTSTCKSTRKATEQKRVSC